jgi:hypothetical protein
MAQGSRAIRSAGGAPSRLRVPPQDPAALHVGRPTPGSADDPELAPPRRRLPADVCRSFRYYAAEVHELFEARSAAGELAPFLDLLLALPRDAAIEHVEGLIEVRRKWQGRLP